MGGPHYYTYYSFVLGTSMTDPFSAFMSTSISLPTQTVTQSGSALTYAGTGNEQHGIDIFLKVDDSGNLWAGDWGHDGGGMFGCGDDYFLGTMQTTIQLVL